MQIPWQCLTLGKSSINCCYGNYCYTRCKHFQKLAYLNLFFHSIYLIGVLRHIIQFYATGDISRVRGKRMVASVWHLQIADKPRHARPEKKVGMSWIWTHSCQTGEAIRGYCRALVTLTTETVRSIIPMNGASFKIREKYGGDEKNNCSTFVCLLKAVSSGEWITFVESLFPLFPLPSRAVRKIGNIRRGSQHILLSTDLKSTLRHSGIKTLRNVLCTETVQL